MPDELPPNKVCPRCGMENIASAVRCFECTAALDPPRPPVEGMLWIGEEPEYAKAGPADAAASRSYPVRRALLRAMGAVGLVLSLRYWRGGSAYLPLLILILFFVGLVMAERTKAPGRLEAQGEPRPPRDPLGGAVRVIDNMLIAAGCLTSALLGLGLSFVALMFAACSCRTR